MTTVKKGYLALPQEWCKHLRCLNRLYWKPERLAGINEAANQHTEAPSQVDMYTAIRARIAHFGGVELPEIEREAIRPVPGLDDSDTFQAEINSRG